MILCLFSDEYATSEGAESDLQGGVIGWKVSTGQIQVVRGCSVKQANGCI
jgi:hypothetical protein